MVLRWLPSVFEPGILSENRSQRILRVQGHRLGRRSYCLPLALCLACLGLPRHALCGWPERVGPSPIFLSSSHLRFSGVCTGCHPEFSAPGGKIRA